MPSKWAIERARKINLRIGCYCNDEVHYVCDPHKEIALALDQERECCARIVTGYAMQVGTEILVEIAAEIRAGGGA